MKNKNIKCIIYFLVLGAGTFSFNLHGTAQSVSQSNQDRIITYPVPSGEQASTDYSVQINGLPVQALSAQVDDRYKAVPHDFGNSYPFIQFDFSGLAGIRIHAPGRDLSKVIVRPQSKNINSKIIDENTIVLTLTEPCILSVEPDGRKRPLLIFANAPEQDVPREGDAGVLYFGPGIHRPESGVVEVKSNQTVYLAGGAVLEGTLRVEEAENVTIRGRGVLSGNRWEWRQGPGYMIDIVNSKNIRIDGIVVRGAPRWTIVPTGSENVTVSNVKICNSAVKFNDDGINPVNSRHIIVRDCFIRTADDCIAIKGKEREWGDVQDIRVENSILWTDFARVTLMGHESRAERMGDIVYRNLEIIHHGQLPIFLLEPGEDMRLENVRFESIRINGGRPVSENTKSRKLLAVIRPNITKWNRTKNWGRIDGISFKDVTLDGGEAWYSFLIEGAGNSDDLRIRNISFENVHVQGELLTAKSRSVILGPWAWGNLVTFY
ncbi:MAG: hypothetical protein JRD68_10650 [Deltaproteobacteria bacterium]|nr:hypothetical protein [Deltaproteobacteria bacterium]